MLVANYLKCDANTCVHNISQRCGASTIQVKGEEATQQENTFCNTFAPRSIYNMVSNIGNMNIIGGIGGVVRGNESLKPKVACTVTNCTHNNGGACVVDYLEIGGMESSSSEETLCQSFRPDY